MTNSSVPTAPTRARAPFWLALVIAVAGGFVYDTAYPAAAVWPLAFVAVAMLLTALIGRSVWGGVAVGGAFGLTFYLVHVSWTARYLGPIPWLALSALEAALFALGSVLTVLAYRWVPKVLPGPTGRLVILPAVVGGAWIARELLLAGFPYTGFPWARVATTQVDGPFAQLVSWIGINGLGFVIVFVVATLIELIRTWRAWARTRVFRFIPLAAAVLVLLTPAFPTTSAGSVVVGSVQGNGPSGYFDDRSTSSILQAQLDATAQLDGEAIDILLWPEGLDADPRNNPRAASVFTGLSEQFNAPVIMNAASELNGLFYNTSMLFTADGLQETHAKRNPVPFGERVPDRWFYEAIVPDLIGLIQREYTPGTDAPYFTAAGTGIGLAICFDVIYDDVIWEGMNAGAQVYMFQTNNADFRGTDENLQQLAIARMRAIETGRAVVNISTVGTSQAMLPTGATLDELPEAVAGAMRTEVPLYNGLTPAIVLGSTIQWLLGWGSVITIALFGLVVAIRRRDLGEQ